MRRLVVVILQRKQILPGDDHFAHSLVGRVGPNARRSHRIGDVDQLDPPVGHDAGDGAGQGDLVQTVGFTVLAHDDWIEAIRGVDHAELDSRDVAQRADGRHRGVPTPLAEVHRTDAERIRRIGDVDDQEVQFVSRCSPIRDGELQRVGRQLHGRHSSLDKQHATKARHGRIGHVHQGHATVFTSLSNGQEISVDIGLVRITAVQRAARNERRLGEVGDVDHFQRRLIEGRIVIEDIEMIALYGHCQGHGLQLILGDHYGDGRIGQI